MKKNKVLTVMLATILCFSFVATSAWAGSEQRYRWEGIAIGLGAAIVGNVLLNGCYYQPPPAPVCYSRPVVYYSPPPVYVAPPVVYCSPPVVRYAPAPWRPYRHWKRHRHWRW